MKKEQKINSNLIASDNHFNTVLNFLPGILLSIDWCTVQINIILQFCVIIESEILHAYLLFLSSILFSTII